MSTYELVKAKAAAAKKAAGKLAITSTAIKNKAMLAMAQALLDKQEEILAANAIDMENAARTTSTPPRASSRTSSAR